MGFVTIGLFSLNVQGIEGALLLMLVMDLLLLHYSFVLECYMIAHIHV